MPLYRASSGVDATAVHLAGPETVNGTKTFSVVQTFTGAQGAINVDCANYSTAAILTTDTSKQLTLQPNTGEYVFVGSNAQPNFTVACIYVRPQTTLDHFAIENTAGSANLYRINSSGAHIFGDGCNLQFGTSTGTKIGTATTQKIGFYNAGAIVQPSGNALSALKSLGLVAANSVVVDVSTYTFCGGL